MPNPATRLARVIRSGSPIEHTIVRILSDRRVIVERKWWTHQQPAPTEVTALTEFATDALEYGSHRHDD